MPNLTGQPIGRYHILEQLGEGGMATVYKAYDSRLERNVAFKVLRTDLFGQAVLEQVLKRFEREAKSLAKLSHHNIVNILDYGEHEDMPYLVMEYLPGGTLKQRMGQRIPWREAIQLLLPVARGLAYAHQHNVIHRDVKPANVLMKEGNIPVLTDFGIAKLLEGTDGHTLTASGVGIGTPEYMAPEQGIGASTIDARADIYSLGIMFYEMVTGRKPYIADTPMAVVLKQMTDPLPRPTDFVTDLPEEVEHILLKALAKEPANRYADMNAMIAAMEGALTDVKQFEAIAETKKVEAKTSVPPPQKKREKKKAASLPKLSPKVMLAALGVIAVVLVVVFGAPLIKQKFSATPVVEATLTKAPVPPPTLTRTVMLSSAIPESTSTPPIMPTLTPDPAIQITLDFIQSTGPTYERTFEFAWDREFYSQFDATKIENGKLIVTGHTGNNSSGNYARGHITLPQGTFGSDMYAVEFEFRRLDTNLDGSCSFWYGGKDGYINADFFSDGMVNFSVTDLGEIASYNYDVTTSNMVTIINLGGRVAGLVNGQLMDTALDIEKNVIYGEQFIQSNNAAVCEFDNYKYWDLSELDVSVSMETTISPLPYLDQGTSLPDWVTDFAEPILQDIQSREPDFQDDFEKKSNFWEPSDFCAANVKVANGVMDILSRCHIYWTRNYDNFVVSFDYRSQSNGSHIIMFYVRQSFPPEGCFFQLDAGGASWVCEPSTIDLGNFTNLSTNHALIIVRNNQFALFINDKPVDIIQVDALKWGNSMLENGTQVQIDNFKLWRIE